MNNKITIEEILSLTKKCKGEFKPYVWYNPIGDCIEVYLANEGIVGEYVNDELTLYRSAVDNRIIGFQLFNPKKIIKENEQNTREPKDNI